jgi:hypothetical protein
MTRRWRTVGALALLLPACGVERLDAGSPGLTDAQKQQLLWPFGAPTNSFDLPCTLPAPAAIAGTWQGQFDSMTLPMGSYAIRVDVTGAFDQPDGLCGKVTFGQSTPWSLATDPTAAPPGEPTNPDSSIFSRPVAGFPYEFYQPGKDDTSDLASKVMGPGVGPLSPTPGFDGDHVHFAIAMRQPVKSWCNLQFSYVLDNETTVGQMRLLGGTKMGCIPTDALTLDASGGATSCGAVAAYVRGVSCMQAAYCSFKACDCDIANPDTSFRFHGCTVHIPGDTPFDLTLDGDELSGTISFVGNSQAQSIHLKRSSNWW